MTKQNTTTTENQPQKKQTPWDKIKETCKTAETTIPKKNKTRINSREMIYKWDAVKKKNIPIGRYGDIKNKLTDYKKSDLRFKNSGGAPQKLFNKNGKLNVRITDKPLPVTAKRMGNTVVYQYPKGENGKYQYEIKIDGDRSWRNNNPGNVVNTFHTKRDSDPANGKVGVDSRVGKSVSYTNRADVDDDGKMLDTNPIISTEVENGFLIMDSYENGERTLIRNIRKYHDDEIPMTIGGALAEYAPKKDNNNVSAYKNTVNQADPVSPTAGKLTNEYLNPYIAYKNAEKLSESPAKAEIMTDIATKHPDEYQNKELSNKNMYHRICRVVEGIKTQEGKKEGRIIRFESSKDLSQITFKDNKLLYHWKTWQDKYVRAKHAGFASQSLKNPFDALDKDQILPGHEKNCRCWAEYIGDDDIEITGFSDVHNKWKKVDKDYDKSKSQNKKQDEKSNKPQFAPKQKTEKRKPPKPRTHGENVLILVPENQSIPDVIARNQDIFIPIPYAPQSARGTLRHPDDYYDKLAKKQREKLKQRTELLEKLMSRWG